MVPVVKVGCVRTIHPAVTLPTGLVNMGPVFAHTHTLKKYDDNFAVEWPLLLKTVSGHILH